MLYPLSYEGNVKDFSAPLLQTKSRVKDTLLGVETPVFKRNYPDWA